MSGSRYRLGMETVWRREGRLPEVLRLQLVSGAGYGDRTRVRGLGSLCTTIVLSPHQPGVVRAQRTLLGNSINHARIRARTSSRLAAIFSGVVASRFKRSSGSVFDGRTLKCQSAYSTDRPSSRYCVASAYFFAMTSSFAATWSMCASLVLISPEMKYFFR